jgi:hypothetical protein
VYPGFAIFLTIASEELKPVAQYHTWLRPQAIGDIVIGSVLGPSSQRANECRIASFFAGKQLLHPTCTPAIAQLLTCPSPGPTP